MTYAKHVTRKITPVPQSKPLDKRQVRNSTGVGHSYALDKWSQLDRFLVLGASGGTFYVGERKLTKNNAKVIDDCLRENYIKTVQRIVDISDSGRAPKNDPAIFALAIAASSSDDKHRREALSALPKVCRIPTHLFQFVAEADELRGWGRGLRRAVGDWYNDVPVDKLAYHVVKYQQRDGWANRDLLRLSHAKPKTGRGGVFRYVVKGDAGRLKVPAIIDAFETAKTEKDPKRIAKIVTKFGLTREMVPTEALNSPEVWSALLEKMPLHAMVRNLGKLTSIGVVGSAKGSAISQTERVISRLGDRAYVQGSRLHPLSILMAMKTYESGHGVKGKLTWAPVPAIVKALDEAFYLAFDNVVPTGKRILLALDVSGSMGSAFIGDTTLSARDATAALALVTAKTEPNYGIIGFTAGRHTYGGKPSMWGANHPAVVAPIDIGPTMRLTQAIEHVTNLPFGGTDCALPMLYAAERKLGVDAFVVLTDSETWAGSVHPKTALAQYRKNFVHDAKLIVVGMTATNFTINDPADPLGLDVVGFDAAVPSVINNFITGDLALAKAA